MSRCYPINIIQKHNYLYIKSTNYKISFNALYAFNALPIIKQSINGIVQFY